MRWASIFTASAVDRSSSMRITWDVKSFTRWTLKRSLQRTKSSTLSVVWITGWMLGKCLNISNAANQIGLFCEKIKWFWIGNDMWGIFTYLSGFYIHVSRNYALGKCNRLVVYSFVGCLTTVENWDHSYPLADKSYALKHQVQLVDLFIRSAGCYLKF